MVSGEWATSDSLNSLLLVGGSGHWSQPITIVKVNISHALWIHPHIICITDTCSYAIRQFQISTSMIKLSELSHTPIGELNIFLDGWRMPLTQSSPDKCIQLYMCSAVFNYQGVAHASHRAMHHPRPCIEAEEVRACLLSSCTTLLVLWCLYKPWFARSSSHLQLCTLYCTTEPCSPVRRSRASRLTDQTQGLPASRTRPAGC